MLWAYICTTIHTLRYTIDRRTSPYQALAKPVMPYLSNLWKVTKRWAENWETLWRKKNSPEWMKAAAVAWCGSGLYQALSTSEARERGGCRLVILWSIIFFLLEQSENTGKASSILPPAGAHWMPTTWAASSPCLFLLKASWYIFCLEAQELR